jgi:MscS family membrane protein
VLDFYRNWGHLAHAILILIGALIATLIVHGLLRKRSQRKVAPRHVWRDAILGALNAPLQALIWMIGLSIAIDALTKNGHLAVLAKVFPPARDVVVIAIVAWFLMRVVTRAKKNFYARAVRLGHEFDETAGEAISKLVIAVIVIAAIVVMMQSLHYSIASVLAFGGVAGIAVGFAAQGLVANLLGGITVFASRPFKVGDAIIFPGTQLMGKVEYIGWRATRVLGWNGKPFYVPNAEFNTKTIINHSRLAYRSIDTYVYLRLQNVDKVPGIVRDVNAMLKDHPEMQHENGYFVFDFDSYGDYALKLLLYAWVKSTTYLGYMQAKEDLLLKITAIIKQHGAELAVPVSTVYVPEGLQLQREYARDAGGPAHAGIAAGAHRE